MADVRAIHGVPRGYAWGSTTAIQALLGLVADGRPLAELWFGAHPDDPSPAGETTLDAVIAADPAGTLGAEVTARFGGLPFLLKLLAADQPLSIQVHPTIEQARAGFDREDAAGLAADAPSRNYRDRNHKPELICALSDFEALCGFRPVARTLALLDRLDVAALEPVRELLAGPDPLRSAVTYLLGLADPGPLVTAVVTAVVTSTDPELAEVQRVVELTGTSFPGDVGVLVALLLNYVRLGPGEAIYLGAGNVHAYLRGLGVEIMANSDNVLRCGLTPKHIDVAEVLHVADFTALDDPVVPAEQVGAATWRYPVPVPDFALERIELDGHGGAVDLRAYGPAVLLCGSGAVEATVDGVTVVLAPGHAAFVPAADGGRTVWLHGRGETFLAGVGDLTE
jgi:mannose-6-phosphate isomerase